MKYFECNSVDVFVDNLKELDLVATQIGKGSFFSQKQNLKLPLIEINHWRINTSILYYGALAQDKIYLSFPVQRLFQKIDGKDFDGDSVLGILPDEELIVLHPEVVEAVDFLIPFSVLQDYYKYQNFTDIIQLVEKLRSKTGFSTSHNLQIKQLTQYTTSVIGQVSQWSYQATLDAQDTILLKIFEILGDSYDQKVIASSKNRTAVVKRAITTIHQDLTSNLTILDLSIQSFCSIRTLEYSFKSILGCTPKEYIIKRRLNLIKHEIKRSPEKSISRIAIDFGVVNAGRFSNDYFVYFGEYPSDTRNK
jgi:AraC family ethanolamine operon transcriptional activator